MSFCRWSCDDFGSDVYCYESSDGGFVTHLAEYRYVGDIPKLDWGAMTDRDIDKFMASYKAQSAYMATAEREKIGLPLDGESFWDATPGECAQRLMSLRETGYRVPQSAIDALLEEVAEEVEEKMRKLEEANDGSDA